MSPEAFLATFAPSCVAAMVRSNGFASVRIAQVALESAWGEATPKDIVTGQESFNLTGIKSTDGHEGPAGSVLAWTQEWDASLGSLVDVKASFRAYHSYDEFFAVRDEMFEWSNYDAYRAAKTPEAACLALQNAPMPYATDPDYASKLIATIAANDLNRFDSWPFADVDGSAWYADFVREMKSKGVLKGDGSGYLRLTEHDIRLLIIASRMDSLRS